MSDLLVLIFELRLIELIEVEVAGVLLGVTVLATEYVLATALDAGQADLLFAGPASRLVLLIMIGY